MASGIVFKQNVDVAIASTAIGTATAINGGRPLNEAYHRNYQALQARRSPTGPYRVRRERHDGYGSQGLRATEGAHGNLPWRRIHRELSAQDSRRSCRGGRAG